MPREKESIANLKRAISRLTEERDEALERLRKSRILRPDTARVAELLHESEERFRNMADNSPVIIWVTDPDGRCTALNRMWFEYTGQAPEKALGFGWLDALHPYDAAAAAEIFKTANTNHEPFQLEYRLRRHDGEYRWCIDSGAPRFGPDGEFLGYVGSVLDIHDRIEAEKALEEKALFHRTLLDLIPGMVFTSRPDGSCDYASQQWADFTGTPTEELLGVGWVTILHPDDSLRAYDEWLRAVESNSPYDLEYRIRRHDGEYEWFKVHCRPMRGRSGETIRWYGTALNINALYLAQNQLRRAQAEAEEANRAKSEFLANMSHEIRTPITAFMAAIEHLLDIDTDPNRRNILELADRSAERLRNLIEDILDFSSIEAQRVELKNEPFSLRSWLDGIVEIFSLSAREKKLRLEVDVSPDAPAILRGDPDRLGQVLINLVGNAVKFTHEGTVRISISYRDESLKISVADTGIGIPQEKLQMLFDSFTQVDASLTRRYGGTGLGLAISKRLVELMGGEIGARSDAEGKGSLFTVSVPLDRGSGQTTLRKEKVPAPAGNPGPGARILLAEDAPPIQKMIEVMLESRSYRITVAENGRKAVERWEEGSFDLILMDLQMPELNGLAATKAIRQREAEGARRTPIIGLTAHVRPEDLEECLSAGMDHVLTKPLRAGDLCRAIDACLADRSRSESG